MSEVCQRRWLRQDSNAQGERDGRIYLTTSAACNTIYVYLYEITKTPGCFEEGPGLSLFFLRGSCG